MAFARRVRTIVQWLNPQTGDRILDCGCGPGFYLMVMERIAPGSQIWGLDGDDVQLTIARGLVSTGQVQLTQGDIYQTPFSNGFFDKIILSEVLEHIPDDHRALVEVVRVLKQGGTIAITVPNHNYPFLWDPLNKTLEALFHTHVQSGLWAGIWNMHLRLYYLDELLKLIEAAGLKIQDIQLQTRYCVPFSHILFYAAKRLLDAGVLPNSLSSAADKFRWSETPRSSLNPVVIGYAFLTLVDRLSDNLPLDAPSVSIGVKALKP